MILLPTKTLAAKLRLVLGGTILVFALGACMPNLPASDVAGRGYPSLMPASFFNMATQTPFSTNNLAGRARALMHKVRSLKGPVIPPRDRLKLEAALRRNNQG